MPRTISSLLWKYFDKTGPGLRASCKVCHQILSYQSTTGNLRSHLKSRHLDHYEAFCNKEDPPEVTDQLSTSFPVTRRIYATGSRPNQRRSPVWKYFVDVDDESQVQCKLCDIISEGKTPYKLKLHLKNHHYKEYEEIENLYRNGNERSSDIPDDDSNSSIKFATEVLNYFEQNQDGSRCTICEQTTESTVEEMKSHLEEEHPGILISILNNKEENTEAEDTYTEIIYLEDEQKQSKHKRRKVNLPQKIETKTDSRPDIDSFLNYLSVLLRNVAKDDMPKLQLDVISHVLNAQMSPVQKQQAKTCNCKETGDLQISVDVGKSEVNVSNTTDSNT